MKKKNILIHIVYMNASYKLPFCFSGVQWSPTLLQRHPNPRCRGLIGATQGEHGSHEIHEGYLTAGAKVGLVTKGKPGERSLGKLGRPPSSMFFVSCLIDFNMIQSPQLPTAIFFINMAMLRNGFVDAIKPNRSSNTKSSRQVFWVTRIDLLPATYGNCNCSKTKKYFRKD